MKYSVIIPLYNKERHIYNAINSVFSQEINDFELIVVDDGSYDSSVDIVKQIEDERIRVISQTNSGVSVARNKGIENARGDYIALLDADDEWLPNHLSSFDKMIDLYPEAGLYATAYRLVVNNEHVDPWNGRLNSFDEIQTLNYFKESYDNNRVLPVHTSAVCIPNRVFKLIGGFAVGHGLGEDLDMWGRIALQYQVIFTNKPSSLYHMDSDNRSTDKKPPDEFPFVSYYRDSFLKNKYTDNIYIKEYVVRQQFIVVKKLLKIGENSNARAILSSVDTKIQKRKLLKYYLISLVPPFIVGKILYLKRLWPYKI